MLYPDLLDPDVIRRHVTEHGAPVLLLSTSTAVDQYRNLQEAMPGVEHHYALKPLPHREIVKELVAAGASFDVCSNGEIDLMAQLGVSPERCIHTHPIKRPTDIAKCVEFGCRTMVFDNVFELDKFSGVADQVDLLLRLSFRSSDAVVDLSYKFGAAPDTALDLLREAKLRGLNVRGLCFHVGSQAAMAYKHVEAIGFCRQIFNLAALEGIHLDTLDIGGGFPVPYTEPVPPIGDFSRPIMEELQRQFPNVRILSEPGRYIAAPAMTLVASVMGKSERGGTMWYYLDDGLYGSYSGKMYDHCNYQVHALRSIEQPQLPRRPSVLAGPTCDSIDVIYEGLLLPELEPGDLIVSPMMGAYTWASATDFNFFHKPTIVRID